MQTLPDIGHFKFMLIVLLLRIIFQPKVKQTMLKNAIMPVNAIIQAGKRVVKPLQ
jgi:hypothetical protein